MFDLAHILEFIVHRFDDGPFFQHDLIVGMHQAVLHVLSDLGDQMDPVHEKLFKEVLAYIAFIAIKLPHDLLVEIIVLQRFPVIDLPLSKHKIQDLTFIINDQVKFEPEEPSNGTLALGGCSLKGPMLPFPFDMTGP